MPLSAKSLLEIGSILKTSSELKDYYKDASSESSHLSIYFDSLYSNNSLKNKIFSCIISENEIADNASAKLSSIRRNKKNIENS